jgi:hypothetical protein
MNKTASHTRVLFLNHNIDPFSKKQEPQNLVFFNKPFFLSLIHLFKTISGSTVYLKSDPFKFLFKQARGDQTTP